MHQLWDISGRLLCFMTFRPGELSYKLELFLLDKHLSPFEKKLIQWEKVRIE